MILYFARGFLEEASGPIDFQGSLAHVPELDLLRDVGVEMIRFFPSAVAASGPPYATILRDPAAAALRRAGTCGGIGIPLSGWSAERPTPQDRLDARRGCRQYLAMAAAGDP